MPGPNTDLRTRESKHGTILATERAQNARAADLGAETWANTAFGDDLLAARWDLPFFSERFLGVKPHPGQARLWDAIIKRDSSGWRPRYLAISGS